MIEVIDKAISPDMVIGKVKGDGSGCIVTYVGLIRDHSQGKPVLSVEYQDSAGNAVKILKEITGETKRKWQIEKIAISHKIGKLRVGDINLVVAIAAAHRREGFAACRYLIDQFKKRPPTRKLETYRDGSVKLEEAAQ